MRLEEISEKAPRAGINGLVYLKDVDTAKELLVGKTVYIQAESVRIDDANNYSGYRDIAIPVNTEATITAIGVAVRHIRQKSYSKIHRDILIIWKLPFHEQTPAWT